MGWVGTWLSYSDQKGIGLPAQDKPGPGKGPAGGPDGDAGVALGGAKRVRRPGFLDRLGHLAEGVHERLPGLQFPFGRRLNTRLGGVDHLPRASLLGLGQPGDELRSSGLEPPAGLGGVAQHECTATEQHRRVGGVRSVLDLPPHAAGRLQNLADRRQARRLPLRIHHGFSSCVGVQVLSATM